MLFVAGELAASAHFVFVGHRVCAEHGELEHAPASHAEHGHGAALAHANAHAHENAEARDAASADESSRGPAFVAGDEQRAEHDHCPFGDKLAPRTVPTAFRARPALGSAVVVPLVERARVDARAFPLHLLAPKHSPPAAS